MNKIDVAIAVNAAKSCQKSPQDSANTAQVKIKTSTRNPIVKINMIPSLLLFPPVIKSAGDPDVTTKNPRHR
jgi:hypothetical protein